MKISILHPTARVTPNYENPWWKAAMSALDACSDPSQVEYILVVHESRYADFAESFKRFPMPAWGRFTVCCNRDRDCLVDQGNTALLAATGEIIVGCDDDQRFPNYWDVEILKCIPDTSRKIALRASSNNKRKDFIWPSIVTKALQHEIGPTCPEYVSMYIDDEWTARVQMHGEIVAAPHIRFTHLHPTVGLSKIDDIYSQENSEDAYKIGREVFQRRRREGFPRVHLPGWPVPAEQSKPGLVRKALDWVDQQLSPRPAATIELTPPLMAICTPGETFSAQWLEAFLNLGVKLGELGFACKRYMGFTSNVYRTRQDITERVMRDAETTGERPQFVLWLDDDNVLLPEQLEGLVKFLQHYSDVDAVAGWCWIHKQHGWATSVGNFWREDWVSITPLTLFDLFRGETRAEKMGPKVIEHTGFPCVLMRYSAVEKLGAAAFRPLTKADLPAIFGEMRPAVERPDDWYCGEDTAWCLKAKQAGLRLVVDPGCKVGHLKLQVQEPDVAKELGLADSPELEDRRRQLNDVPVPAPVEYQAM